jgi:hypothetical protein
MQAAGYNQDQKRYVVNLDCLDAHKRMAVRRQYRWARMEGVSRNEARHLFIRFLMVFGPA